MCPIKRVVEPHVLGTYLLYVDTVAGAAKDETGLHGLRKAFGLSMC